MGMLSGMSPLQCLPTWYSVTNETCPYGIALPGDVTLLRDPGIVDFVAVAYGYTPYLVCLLAFLDLVVRRGSRQLALCLLAAVLPMANEILVKPLVAQPRPGALGFVQDDSGRHVGSCVLSCGSPSSHATISIGLWLFVFLDAAARVVPSSDQLLGQAVPAEASSEARAVTSWPLRSLWTGIESILPRNIMTSNQFIIFILFWSFLLLPVPIMRVRSYDHTVEQVLLGGIAGVAYAAVWHRAISFLTYQCTGRLGTFFCCGLLQHNYAPAEFQIRVFEHRGVQGAKVEIIGYEEWKQRHAGEPSGSAAASDTVAEGKVPVEP